jgi:mevalonate kinase
VARPIHLLIADTGIPSPTKVAVGDVRRSWEQNRSRLEALFDAAGDIARQARSAIETGATTQLGPLMDQNQAVLVEMGVSSPELAQLIAAARAAGAAGAKLSGGGRGGNMIALVAPETAGPVARALRNAGAVRVIRTTVPAAGVVDVI